jgi:hypothetical protein
MEILTWLFGGITSFLGNVLANDFCAAAPKMSEKIIAIAVRRFPDKVRARYLEQWHADLLDQPGAIAKIKWSIGCLVSAYKMRREVNLDSCRRLAFQVESSNGSVTVTAGTVVLARWMGRMLLGKIWGLQWLRWLPRSLQARVIVYAAMPAIESRYGKVDFPAAKRLFEMQMPWTVSAVLDGVVLGNIDDLRVKAEESR